jgi:electron transfer flavoprotein beta subunit
VNLLKDGGPIMKILVCVKQVIDPDSPVQIADSGREIETGPGALFRMNRFDEFALEEALRLREAFPGTQVDAVTVGPARVSRTVRRALEIGADEGIHILLQDGGIRMPSEIASFIHDYAAEKRYDLILAGIMAEDDMQAQVGPMLAEMLGYPWATAVMKTAVSPPSGTVRVERELEGGRREAFELTLPALLTVQSGINRPRYPALSHVLRARTQPLITIPVSEMRGANLPFVAKAGVRILSFEKPVCVKTAFILSGSPKEKAEKLLKLLQEKALL